MTPTKNPKRTIEDCGDGYLACRSREMLLAAVEEGSDEISEGDPNEES
jgi:hypothetical protein